MQVLLDSGGAIDLPNEAGITALMSSAFYGHDPVVSQLLQRGANARSADKRKRTALHWAAMNDHDQVRLLMLCIMNPLQLLQHGGGAFQLLHAAPAWVSMFSDS